MDTKDLEHSGFAGKLAGFFIDSKLTPLAIIGSLLLGILAVVMLPREEEPQIKVPMIFRLAKVQRSKQLGKADEMCPLSCGVANGADS